MTSKAIHWKFVQATGNPYLKRCHPAMMTKEGMVYHSYPRSNSKRTEIQSIQYDEQYVFEKFENDFLKPLDMTMQEFYIWFMKLNLHMIDTPVDLEIEPNHEQICDNASLIEGKNV